jgi:hypothetical protein
MTRIAWLASYPKSGSTWLRCMLASYLTGEPPSSVHSLNKAIPDLHKMLGSGEAVPLDGDETYVVKTHFLPSAGILRLYRHVADKAVYLVRNPRDIMLSGMRHMGIRRDDLAACRRFVEEFIANEGQPFWRDHFGQGSWTTNVQSWTEPSVMQRCFPNTEALVVRYEDMRGDPVGTLRQILEFLDLGRPVDLDDVRRAVEHSTLDSMRALERRSPVEVPGFSPFGGHGEFVGEGRHNQSLAFIGDDVEAAYLNRAAQSPDFALYLKRFGYDL